jgi:hypothetical protein
MPLSPSEELVHADCAPQSVREMNPHPETYCNGAMSSNSPVVDHLDEPGPRPYRLSDVLFAQLRTILTISSSVLGETIYLLPAVRVQRIGPRARHEVRLAHRGKKRKQPRLSTLLRIVPGSGPMLTYAVKRDTLSACWRA